MNSSTLSRLLRRNTVLAIALLLLSCIAGLLVSLNSPLTYQLASESVLVPGDKNIASGQNQLLYLDQLSQANAVLTSALSSDSVQGRVASRYGNAVIQVETPTTSSGPTVSFVVSATTLAQARGALTEMQQEATDLLQRVQSDAGVATAYQIKIIPVYEDAAPLIQSKSRIQATAASTIGALVISALLLLLVDRTATVLATRTRGRRSNDSRAVETLSGGRQISQPVIAK